MRYTVALSLAAVAVAQTTVDRVCDIDPSACSTISETGGYPSVIPTGPATTITDRSIDLNPTVTIVTPTTGASTIVISNSSPAAPTTTATPTNCVSAYNACQSTGGADCIGHKQACQAACLETFDTCRVQFEANHATCAAEYAECVVETPFSPNGTLTLFPLTENISSAPSTTTLSATAGLPVTVTEVVTSFTTYCPAATTLTVNNKTYTVTEATTLTITDCPCTLTSTTTPSVTPGLSVPVTTNTLPLPVPGTTLTTYPAGVSTQSGVVPGASTPTGSTGSTGSHNNGTVVGGNTPVPFTGGAAAKAGAAGAAGLFALAAFVL